MNENESPYSLAAARADYLSEDPSVQDRIANLTSLGYSLKQCYALFSLWESDRNLSQDNLEAWQRCADLNARADDLVACNPVFLIVDAIRDNLVGLEDRIHAILSYLAPYPLHHPDSITPAAVTNIRQSLTTLTVTDLPHHRLVLSSLERRLQYAENDLHEFCPEQADTEEVPERCLPDGTQYHPIHIDDLDDDDEPADLRLGDYIDSDDDDDEDPRGPPVAVIGALPTDMCTPEREPIIWNCPYCHVTVIGANTCQCGALFPTP